MTTPRFFLQVGNHPTLEQGACAMELTAWMAGEPHSDHPRCTSPVIGAFVRRLNDRLPDDARQRLLPLLLDVIGTNTGPEDDRRRAFRCADWACREVLPRLWDATDRAGWAAELRALAPVVDAETARGARAVARRHAAYANAAAADAAAAYANAAAAYAAAAAADAAAYAAAAAADAAYANAAAAYAAAAAADAADAADAYAPAFREWYVGSAIALVRDLVAIGRSASCEVEETRVATWREQVTAGAASPMQREPAGSHLSALPDEPDVPAVPRHPRPTAAYREALGMRAHWPTDDDANTRGRNEDDQ